MSKRMMIKIKYSDINKVWNSDVLVYPTGRHVKTCKSVMNASLEDLMDEVKNTLVRRMGQCNEK